MDRVLVVDDERNMRRTLRDILEDRGFEVSTADCGERAVELCRKSRYQAVLMDVRMPGIDGVEAMRRIRRFDGDVQFVFMSAYTLEHLEDQALREGAVAFLRKPLDAEKIIRLIRERAACR